LKLRVHRWSETAWGDKD